jgi:cell division protein FtsL
MRSSAAVYRMFKRTDGDPPALRTVVIALVITAAALTTLGVLRVARQHEVLRLGFELSRRSEQLGRMHEARRALELERATLAAPDRIRRLATQLGMAPVSPDRIRRLADHPRAAAAAAPAPRAPGAAR